MPASNVPSSYRRADREACRFLVELRGILIAHDLFCSEAEDDPTDVVFEARLQAWSKAVLAFLEHAYGAAMTLLGLPVDRERCRRIAYEKLKGSLSDDQVIAVLTDALEEAVYILRAALEDGDIDHDA